MQKKMMLIVNPAAGSGGYKYNFTEALYLLSLGGYTVTLFYTRAPGDASIFAREHGAEYDVVSCIGGDGTLSEVLSGLMQIKNPPPVGYMPMGTANDVATTLALPKNDSFAAAKRILNGTPHPFDVGGFADSDYFAYIAAFGAFTEVSYATPQDQKKVLGHLAYVIQGIGQLGKIEPIHTIVEYDGGRIEANLLYGSMSNSTSVAGIVRLPEQMVCLGDGMSELVLVREPKNVLEFNEMTNSVLSQRFDSEGIMVLHTKKAKFTFDKPIAWTRDGEAGGEYRQVELRNIKAPVQLIF